MGSSFYKEFFPQAAEHIVLNDGDAKEFELFATEVHEYGLDWWFADGTACWGRREPGESSARIRLGRLGVSRTGAYVTVSVKTNGKELLQRDHGELLETLGTLQNDSRYVIPMRRAMDLIRNEEFVLSLIALSPPRDDDRGAFWEADFDDQNQLSAAKVSATLPPKLGERTSETGVPPGSSVQRMVFVRKGHQAFRKGVVKHWEEQCAVRGPIDKRLLIASHIVPWSEANEQEKTDPDNGLLLSSPLDALFDLGLISFSDVGEMLIRDLDAATLRAFGLAGGVFGLREPKRLLTEEMKKYLNRHRRSHGFSTD